jgi:hypothetical protein
MTNTVIINNLDEAVQYFIQKNTEENVELCKIEPRYHNHGLTGEPICYILERIDKNFYFLFYREDSKKGFEDEFGLPGMGDEYFNISTNAVKTAAFDYNNAAIVVVFHNGKIVYTLSLDAYHFIAKYNTII